MFQIGLKVQKLIYKKLQQYSASKEKNISKKHKGSILTPPPKKKKSKQGYWGRQDPLQILDDFMFFDKLISFLVQYTVLSFRTFLRKILIQFFSGKYGCLNIENVPIALYIRNLEQHIIQYNFDFLPTFNFWDGIFL